MVAKQVETTRGAGAKPLTTKMDEQAKPADTMNEQYVDDSRETSRVQEHVVVDDDRETSHDHEPELPEVESPEVELDHTLMGQIARTGQS